MSGLAISMPFTQFGSLRKIVTAARFDMHVPVGWPELRIIKTANIIIVVFPTNATEPKPTVHSLSLREPDPRVLLRHHRSSTERTTKWLPLGKSSFR